ncbi:MAG: MBL fold metallo-hydrolase [Muribaculaceae bacterium]|nr:MBL fold metallo-hydrolase [Muribaculaceae bacterium]
MTITRFINSIFSSNSFIIEEEGDAILVDVGDWEPLSSFLTSRRLNLKAVFLTHTHYDHIYGIRELMKEFPSVTIYTSPFGKEALTKSNWNFSRYHDDPIEISSPLIVPVVQDQEINISEGLKVKIIETPGHDKSCLSYIIRDSLFTGDSYIPNIKVVASFPNSNKAKASYFYDFLKSLSKDYRIYPGHN